MARADVDRDLLFGLLAVQTGLIDRPALALALRAWLADKSRMLAQVLVDQGAIAAALSEHLEGLVAGQVEAHDGDATRSLAAVDVGESTLEVLAEVGDPDLDATLDMIRSATTQRASVEPTRSFAISSSGVGAGRYRVLRPHKRGGLGAVFVALDSELNREVALKQILDRHADDPTSRSRFLLEAEITGGLEHPGIVPVYGLGNFPDGRPYYAMRFIKGDSLKDAIAAFHRDTPGAGSRPLELRKLLRRFLDVCNAIEYAHQRGVLHRDLKPGNVMVGKYGETLVVDWGLAKPIGHPEPGASEGEVPLSPSHSSGTVETLPGSAIGTPSYMSPEQAAGDSERLGPRSDVYSLGATLYCLLTGRPPHEGPDAGAILHSVRSGKLIPPRKHEPTIDRALEAVCLKALAFDPDGRYATPSGLAEDVERWMADEPVSAYREPRSKRLARWSRRHSSLVSGLVVSLVAAVVGLSTVAWLVARHNRRLEVARNESRIAGEMAHRAVRTMLYEVAQDDLMNVPQGEKLRVKLSERALELYRDFVKLHPADLEFDLEHARVEEQVARLYRMTGKWARARVGFDSAMGRVRDILLRDPSSVPGLDFLGYLEGALAELIKLSGGSDAEAEPHYRESVRIAGELRDRLPDAPRHAKQLAVNLNDLAACLTRAGRLSEAEPLLERAVSSATAFRASLPSSPDPSKFSIDRVILPLVRCNQAGTFTKLGRGSQAEAAVRPAIDELRSLSLVYPDSVDARHLLAVGLRELADAKALEAARLGEALEHLDEAVGLYTRLIAEHPEMDYYPKAMVSLRGDRGAMRLAAGRPIPALEDLEFADGKLAARIAASPPDADSLGQHSRVKAALARLDLKEGRRDRARTFAEEAVVMQEKAVALEPGAPAAKALLEKHKALRAELAAPGP